ncbi:MAG: hypothetical protein VXY77_00865 [Pseudomonadota bacterium]|nr:hypothetical protein [Pseudomonadota bacterium]
MPTKPQKLLNQLSSININDVNNMVVNFIFSYTTISSITNMLPSLASPMLIYPLFVFNICTAFLCTYTLQLHQLAKIQAIEQAHLNYISRLQTPQKSFPLVKAFIISLISLLCFIVIRDSRLLPYFLTKNILNTPFVSLNRLDGGFVILLGYYWMNLSNHPIATTLPTIFVHSKLLKLIHNITSSNTYSNYSNFISKVLVCHIGLSTTYISFKDNLKTSLKAHDLQLKAKQIAAQKLKTSSSDHKKPLLLIPCLGK